MFINYIYYLHKIHYSFEDFENRHTFLYLLYKSNYHCMININYILMIRKIDMTNDTY